MRRAITRIAVAVAVAGVTGSVLLAGTPAHAERWHGEDPVRDVAAIHGVATSAPCGAQTTTTGLDRPVLDLTGLDVDHARRYVTVRLSLGEVKARAGRTYAHVLLATSRTRYLVTVLRRPGGLTVALARNPRLKALGEDPCADPFLLARPQRCEQLAARVDVHRDTVAVRMSRECLGSPRWVKVGAGVGAERQRGARALDVAFDVWGATTQPVYRELPAVGPRVYAQGRR